MSPEHATTKPLRVPDSIWAIYGNLCSRLDTSRAQRIIEHMAADIRLHGTPEEKEILEQALANRPKRGPKPKSEQ